MNNNSKEWKINYINHEIEEINDQIANYYNTIEYYIRKPDLLNEAQWKTLNIKMSEAIINLEIKKNNLKEWKETLGSSD